MVEALARRVSGSHAPGGGCTLPVGCSVVLVLVVAVAGPLILGYLFPWEPPAAEDAPRGAVVRVIVPEEEPYWIQWGGPFSASVEEGKIDPDLGYRDHPVPPEHFDGGEIRAHINLSSPEDASRLTIV